ncbi:MAG: hypothetical protein WBF42_15145 [Terracidiphilus sp.]
MTASADIRVGADVSTISAEELQTLPIPARNWQEMVVGASSPGADEGGDEDAAARRLGRPATFTVDGVSTRLAFGVTSATQRSSRSFTAAGVGESAIRTVRVLDAEAGSETGGAGGVRAGIQTRRGESALHGHGAFFDRESAWGAQNPLAQWVRETVPGTALTVPVFTPEAYTPSDRETIWGFGAGGPLGGKRLFWFGALDGYVRNDAGVSIMKHADSFFAQPSNDQMQVLSARLGLSSPNPVAAGIGAYSGALQTLAGLLGPAPRRGTQWNGLLRLDWTATERNHFTLEGTGTYWNAPGGGLTRVAEPYGSHSYGESRANQQMVIASWQRSITQNLIAVTQGSMGRHILTMPAETPSAWEQSLLVSNWAELPQIVVDGGYGFTIGNPSQFGQGSYPDEHLYQLRQQFDWVRKPLLLKMGAELRRSADATSHLRNQTGTYYYSTAENFASDALAFARFGINGQLNPYDQHNCDQTGRVWRDTTGTLHGLGYLPCYEWYSQTMGPANWNVETNDWAGYVTGQWQAGQQAVVSLGLRWELEQMPPSIAMVDNPDLPLTEKLPGLGSQWGPRASLAWGTGKSNWPVVRVGYGMYFGRTPNATLQTVLTQTGSLKGDLNFFMRPTDNLYGGGAPPFPYVLSGEPATAVKPDAVEFAPTFRNGEVQQGVVSIEQPLPGRIHLEASGLMSMGRRLPVTFDANIDPAANPAMITYAVVDGNGSGPIKAAQITVPFFASWPSALSPTGFAGRLNANYQQISEMESRANSAYEAAMVRVTRSSRRGVTLHARYTYAHAMDWNPNESALVNGPSVLDPTNFAGEYGTSNLDVRHSVTIAVTWSPAWKLRGWEGRVANAWTLASAGYAHRGLPYTMRTAGSVPKEFTLSGTPVVGLSWGMNGYGGSQRVYGVGRNTYRYPATWKGDARVAKRFSFGRERQLELLAESFNLLNHRNVTQLETVGYTIGSGTVSGGLPTLKFLTGLKSGQTEFGQPLDENATTFYRERQIQFGARVRF